MILLFKYWNLVNDFPYTTYQSEKFVIRHFDYETDLQYNLFHIIDELHLTNPRDEQNQANRQAKLHRKNIKLLLENDMDEYALMELNKLLPEIGS